MTLDGLDRLRVRLPDVGLLILRVAVSAMMLNHGWGKLANFGAMAEGFSDPLGVGPTASLTLTVFAEFFCAIFVMAGFATRAAALPLLITMLVAVVIVHSDDPFSKKEFALLYAVPFLVLMLTGPGRWSVDAWLEPRLRPWLQRRLGA